VWLWRGSVIIDPDASSSTPPFNNLSVLVATSMQTLRVHRQAYPIRAGSLRLRSAPPTGPGRKLTMKAPIPSAARVFFAPSVERATQPLFLPSIRARLASSRLPVDSRPSRGSQGSAPEKLWA